MAWIFFFFNLLRQSQHFRNFQEPAERAVLSKSKLFPGWSFCPTGDSPCGCVWEAAPCHTVLVSSDHRSQIWGLGKKRKDTEGGRSRGIQLLREAKTCSGGPSVTRRLSSLGVIRSY